MNVKTLSTAPSGRIDAAESPRLHDQGMVHKAANQSSEHYCRKQPPGESQKCLDQLNKKSYSEYEKERGGQTQ